MSKLTDQMAARDPKLNPGGKLSKEEIKGLSKNKLLQLMRENLKYYKNKK